MAATIGLASCDDYLDKQPDSRMDLETPSDVSKLLVTTYPAVHPAYMLEVYSDNSDCNINTGWESNGRLEEQAFNWEDITEDGNEAPSTMWTLHYATVTNANVALQHIYSQSEEAQKEYDSQKGEALLCRAYAIFQLANMFCQAYDETTADTDLGLPFPEKPETNVHGQYSRGTLAQLYARLAADIEEGVRLVNGATYSKPKYHFNSQAACAFAARFFLYYHKYDKAIEYADKVLGDNPKEQLRDWRAWSQLTGNGQVAPSAYVSSSLKANLLLQTVVSEWGVICGPYALGEKYSHSAFINNYETTNSEGPWGKTSEALGNVLFFNSSSSKYCTRKIPFDMEYSDIQAGIGYPHSTFAVFTTDETLMVRAEAKAMLGRYRDAVDDLNIELSAMSLTGAQLTLDDIKTFYSDSKTKYYTPTNPTPRKMLHTAFAIEQTTQEPLLQCILHLRRILTIHEGMRMQDVKRYGITIYRRTVRSNYKITEVTDTMEARDPRLAFQLPQDAITAGLQPNPRNK